MVQLRDLPCGPPGSALHPSHLAMMKPPWLPLTVLSGTHTGASVVERSVAVQEGRNESCLMELVPDLSWVCLKPETDHSIRLEPVLAWLMGGVLT